MKRKWRLWAGLAISGAALVVALVGLDVARMIETLSDAEYAYLAPATVAIIGYLITRSMRWRLLLGSGADLASCFWITNIGYTVSNVLPFRLGDPARAAAIAMTSRVKVGPALSSVVIERVMDMLMVVGLLAITLPFVRQAGWIKDAGLAAGIAAVVAVTVLIALARKPVLARNALSWALERIPRLGRQRSMDALDSLLEGLGPLRSTKRFAEILGWSIVSWVLVSLYYYCMLWAFLDRPSLAQGSFLTCAIGLGMAVPAAPGALGVFHAFARYALELPFGVATEDAVTVAFAGHAFQYVLVTVLGLIGLVQMNQGLDLARAGLRSGSVEEPLV